MLRVLPDLPVRRAKRALLARLVPLDHRALPARRAIKGTRESGASQGRRALQVHRGLWEWLDQWVLKARGENRDLLGLPVPAESQDPLGRQARRAPQDHPALQDRLALLVHPAETERRNSLGRLSGPNGGGRITPVFVPPSSSLTASRLGRRASALSNPPIARELDLAPSGERP